MKKALALLALLALTLTLAGVAPAENSENKPIICGIENGSYVIRIPVDENDQGWRADDGAADGVVRLAGAEVENGAFVIQYDPMADGETTVSARHYYCAAACGEAHAWDLKVENGAVTGCAGGSYTCYIPDEDDQKLDAFLSGEWLEKDTQFTQMTIARNPEMGWDVEIISPMTHGAYVFKATAYYDCYENAFLYDKGKFYAVPITDSEDASLGEAIVAGASGRFQADMDEEEQRLVLRWINSESPDEIIAFERYEGAWGY